jgi:hypothetical protein
MPIPQANVFKRNTSPNSIFVGYGGNMAKVLAALEAYWENRANGQEVEERLLYCMWKECRRWLKLKAGKPAEKQSGELFMRRKLNVEVLRDASLERLVEIAPRVAEALGQYQENKQGGPLQMALKPMGPGYQRERVHYLQQGKRSGATISESSVQASMRTHGDAKNMRAFVAKGYANLSVADSLKIERLYPMPPVQFKNKIERLRFLISVNEDGLLCNLEGDLVAMTETRFDKYMQYPYAMDRYGNLFMDSHWGEKNYVKYDDRNGSYQMAQTWGINHSSLLAGADVLCAGCIHIGYNCATGLEEPGVLSSIDNISGHYKPTRENLANCIQVLRDQGVSTDSTRVEVRTAEGDIRYWGRDFVRNMRPWPNSEQPPPGFLKPPPIF